MIDYVKGYPDADGSGSGWLTQDEMSQRFPLLLQWDKRWGYIPYGDNVIGLSGCAPTCLSMVIVGLTGNKDATPDAIAQYAMDNGYYVDGVGTAWSLMTAVGGYGVVGQETTLSEDNIYNELENGNPIICSMRPGDFTSVGHFIVLTGMEDGKIRVNDPNSLTRSRQLWDYDTLSYQISNLWVFERQ
ncbi:MAG: C39 family peptidase [Lachnospiraceae bacterium]|nr:C39 family peptidase [Lachnospiraceae bacterium]